MSGIFQTGFIQDPKKDRFATSGPHLHIEMSPGSGPQRGVRFNPTSHRTLLQNILLGNDRIPLVQEKSGTWQWNFPITSGFGRRDTGIPNATTDHGGIDIGNLPIGTPVYYRGEGSYQPDAGFGTIKTTDPQGRPFDIRLLHTRPGPATGAGPTAAPPAPTLPPPLAANKDPLTDFMQDLIAQALFKRMGQSSASSTYSGPSPYDEATNVLSTITL